MYRGKTTQEPRWKLTVNLKDNEYRKVDYLARRADLAISTLIYKVIVQWLEYQPDNPEEPAREQKPVPDSHRIADEGKGTVIDVEDE